MLQFKIGLLTERIRSLCIM